MSDELRLPENLAACEARLAAMALPATVINRDELMYRAGWAAGAETARLAVVNTPPSKGGARGGIRLISASLTSAVVAASLAVWATLAWQPIDVAQVAVAPPQSNAAAAARPDKPRPAARPSTRFASNSRQRQAVPAINVGLLALRHEALFRPSSGSDRVAASNGDLPASAAKTARELLDELFPAAALERPSTWPWKNNLAGESI